jgi:hypothetical protein
MTGRPSLACALAGHDGDDETKSTQSVSTVRLS